MLPYASTPRLRRSSAACGLPGSASEPEALFKSVEEKAPNSWSRDSQSLLFTSIGAKTGADLWTRSPNGERHARPFVQTEFQEGQASISPDGRWIAYSSGERGPRN